MHLRAQLDIPASAVARVVNTAVAHGRRASRSSTTATTRTCRSWPGPAPLGLGLWLALAAAGLAGRGAARSGATSSPRPSRSCSVCVLFHFYGLFQGMAYIPVDLLPLRGPEPATRSTLDPRPLPAGPRGRRRASLLALGALVLVSAVGYARGPRLREPQAALRASPAYLPDEAAEFEGFYRPETGPAGEFRWMARRGDRQRLARRAVPPVVHLRPPRRSSASPVVLSLRFEGRDAGTVVFRRPGTVEQRFDFGAPGALRLSVSRTFRPGGEADRRELGVVGQRDPLGVTPLAGRGAA